MSELVFPLINNTSRKIIHIDMDAFFAAVEEREDPSLRGKPVVIARHPKETSGRGVVSTCNYEARKYGIHSAMSSQEAYNRCPHAVFVSGNYQLYTDISKQIQEIFHQYTDITQPMSIDEAYLDVTKNKLNESSAIKIARMIQQDIYTKTGLTCSAGVSYNKFLAKIASDYKKPAGMAVITPEGAVDFLKQLPIEKFHGVGKKSVPCFHELGIYTGADLYAKNEMDLIRLFGRMGYSLYRKVRGIHNSPVAISWNRKSVGKERTYGTPLTREDEMQKELRKLAQRVEASLTRTKKHGRTVVVKIRYEDFSTFTKRITISENIYKTEDIYHYAKEIFDEAYEDEKGIRLLGVTVTTLSPLYYELITLPLWQETSN
ncbi:MAG: DNA polymerase IV [Streptococcaceae bacterium]|jgi:DNA polymerase-4|nr:DNA polymerase IV [Streptococcaceae bacterium]